MKTDEWNGSRCFLLIFLALPWETTGKKWQQHIWGMGGLDMPFLGGQDSAVSIIIYVTVQDNTSMLRELS